MAACDDDRQLTEAERQAGYQQQRTGVRQALRPFSGRATLPNLLDYINRELVPAVRQTRSAVNDIYLPVIDNAPSANPLQYYFSTDTANADPTTGFVRLDASPQNTATTIRVSETNARLGDALPWLEVMAGGATTPLGVVTLSDAVNPSRFLRFDLDTMADQGTYWNLGVTPIESSHDDPFVDGGGLVMSFIPGVASGGVTVPPGSVTPIGANTVLGNPTTSPAAPTEIAVAENSVLGRSTATGTGNIESIAVPGTSFATGEVVFLQSSSLRNHVRFFNLTYGAFPLMNNNRFIGNVSGATSRPTNVDLAQLAQDLFGIGFDPTTHNFRLSDVLDNTFMGNISGATTHPQPTPLSDLDSISITYENVGKSFIREALTGDVTALQNNNTVTINANAVTDAKLRDSAGLSVIGRAANSTGDPADIVAANDAEVLRRSGTSLGFGTVATAGIADNAVTNAKLRQGGALSVIGRSANSTGNVADISATAASGAVLRESGSTLGFGTIATAGLADDSVTNAKLANMAAGTVKGRQIDAGTGDPVDLTGAEIAEIIRFPNRVVESTGGTLNDYVLTELADTLSITANATLSGIAHVGTGKRIIVANGAGAGSGIIVDLLHFTGSTGGNRFVLPKASTLRLYPGDGIELQHDVTGNFWFTTGGVKAYYRANSTGIGASRSRLNFLNGTSVSWTAADVSADDEVTVTPNVIANSISNTLLRDSVALSVIGRSANSSGDPADISAVAASGAVLRESGSTLGFGTVATAGLADNAVTDGKLRDSAALSVIGRSANSSGDPADIAAAANDRLLARTSNTLAFQQLTDGMVPTNTVGLTKLANILDNRWLGNVSGSTGAVVANDLATFNSTTIIYESTGKTFIRQALTGDVTASQNSNATTITNGAVTSAKLRNSASLSVIGNPTNASTVPSDIAAANDGEVLRRSGTTLGFGTIATAGIANDAVTDGKLRDSAALSVIGRSANSTGDPADIAAGTDGHVLRRSGTTLGFGTVATAGIADGAVTLAKMADLVPGRIIGQPTGGSPGAPIGLTGAQAIDIIEGETPTWTGSHTFNGTSNVFGGTSWQASPSGNATLSAGGTLTLAGTTLAQVTSPFRVASTLAFDSVLSSSEGSSVDNKSIGSINVWRLNPTISPLLLNGMTATLDGQVVLVTNTSTTNNIQVTDEGSTTAAARFALGTTSILIEPLRGYVFWYDGTDDRWKGIGNYPT